MLLKQRLIQTQRSFKQNVVGSGIADPEAQALKLLRHSLTLGKNQIPGLFHKCFLLQSSHTGCLSK